MTSRFAVLLFATALMGCGALEGENPDPNEDGVEACTELVNSADPVPETAGFAFFGPAGGTVADGTYVLTKFEVFAPGSVDPYQRRHTMKITGDKVEVVTQKNAEPEVRRTATMTTEGSTVTFAVDCPEVGVESFGYTASDTGFVHIIEGDGIKEMHWYTKQ